jgi:hypothetical protein
VAERSRINRLAYTIRSECKSTRMRVQSLNANDTMIVSLIGLQVNVLQRSRTR